LIDVAGREKDFIAHVFNVLNKVDGVNKSFIQLQQMNEQTNRKINK
jgi:hypothetical protein